MGLCLEENKNNWRNQMQTVFREFKDVKFSWVDAKEEFIQEKRNPISFQEIPDINFHFYEMKDPVIDGTGPILFNNQYGILGIYNGFGPRIIFLKNSDKELSLKVLKALQE